MLKRAFLTAALLCAAATARADENRGFEFGLGVSRPDFQLDPEYVGVPLRDHTTGFNVFVGYRFFPQLAVEAQYFDSGKVEWGGVGAKLTLDGKAYGASVLGTLPLGHGFGVFGRAGYLRGELHGRLTLDGDLYWDDTSENKPFFGAGVRAMLDGAQVRLEYNRMNFDFVDIELYQFSVAWLF